MIGRINDSDSLIYIDVLGKEYVIDTREYRYWKETESRQMLADWKDWFYSTAGPRLYDMYFNEKNILTLLDAAWIRFKRCLRCPFLAGPDYKLWAVPEPEEPWNVRNMRLLREWEKERQSTGVL